MLTQYAFSILFIDKKKAKFSNDRFGIKDVIMIVEMFFIYVMIVLVVVVIKAVSKVGHGSSSGITFEDVKEQYRKNREEIKELKGQIKAAGLDTLFPQKGK